MLRIAEIERTKFPHFLSSLVLWAEKFDYFSILNSNSYEDKYGSYELLAAFGAARILKNGTPDNLKQFYEDKPSWLFGHFGYDLKNQLENLSSQHTRKFEFEDLTFFEPMYVFKQTRNSEKVEILMNTKGSKEEIDLFIKTLSSEIPDLRKHPFPKLSPKQTKEEYLKAIESLKAEIQYGNIYEINYCQEFYAENVSGDPSSFYLLLNERSPMPFSAFYRNKQDYLISASPERYIAKRRSAIYSQPIKGTSKRGATKEEDEQIKQELKADLKEQTENVMIVDLVRNDLSRTAKEGSVEVEELFGVYTFPQVHQLISTVKSKLSEKYHFVDAIKYSFPMGSMTGAPKISAMKLADFHEKSRRELYSGSVGTFPRKENLIFNVVIRSLLYSASEKYLSLTVGGAITIMSTAENEYNECLLKAKAIFELQNN